jgi:hypothetical protein
MSMVLKSSDIRQLSNAEKKKAFIRYLESARPVNSTKRIKELRLEIRKFEHQCFMSTYEMLERICSGELPDKGKYATWRKKYMILRAHEADVRDSA